MSKSSEVVWAAASFEGGTREVVTYPTSANAASAADDDDSIVEWSRDDVDDGRWTAKASAEERAKRATRTEAFCARFIIDEEIVVMTKVDLPKEEQRVSNENVVGGPGVIFMTTELVPDSLRSANSSPDFLLVRGANAGAQKKRKTKKQL